MSGTEKDVTFVCEVVSKPEQPLPLISIVSIPRGTRVRGLSMKVLPCLLPVCNPGTTESLAKTRSKDSGWEESWWVLVLEVTVNWRKAKSRAPAL